MYKQTNMNTGSSDTNLTKILLLMLAGGALITVAVVPGVGYALAKIEREQIRRAKRRGILSATLKRLEKQKLTAWAQQDGNTILKLTDNGRKKVLRYNIEALTIQKTPELDGLIRVIIFDIPEKQKAAREILRRKLKECGLKQLQKSVFVTPYECREEITFLKNALEISPYVTYILAKEVSDIILSP